MDAHLAPDPLLKNVPPHSLDAERAVLGAVLIDSRAVDDVAEEVGADDFYSAAHSTIFGLILELWQKNEPVDVVLLNEELGRRGVLDQVGGTAALAELCEVVPTSANAAYYARIVRDRAMQRRLIEIAAQVQKDAFETGGTVEELLDRSERVFFEVTQKRIKNEAVRVGSVVGEAYERLAVLEKGGGVTGLPSGFADLDEIASGFNPGEMTILAARPSMGKCLAADAEIVLADGRVSTIEAIVEAQEAELLTLDDDLRFRTTSPSAFIDDGIKPVFRVTTKLGRVVETTLTHPFLRVDGWTPLAEVSVGDRIGVPRAIPVFGDQPLRECEVKLLAYLIGDGCLTGSNPLFTNTREALIEEFEAAVRDFGGVRAVESISEGRAPTWRISADPEATAQARSVLGRRISEGMRRRSMSGRALAKAVGVSAATVSHWRNGETAPPPGSFSRVCEALELEPNDVAPSGLDAARKNAKNPVTCWLADLGLMGKDAHTKQVPEPVFQLPRHQLAVFLSRLMATDGWVSVLASGSVQAGYGTASRRLARQLQHLLLRFGVLANLKERQILYRGERRPSFQLDITHRESLEIFLEEIGVFGKGDAVDRARMALEGRRRQSNWDHVPVGVWKLLEQAKGSESWASLARRAGLKGTSNIHVGKRGISRARLAQLAEALGSAHLQDLAKSDLYWDEVVSIEALGLQQVYDLTIPETHNFVANDVCVHNTSFALNVLKNIVLYKGASACFFSLEMPRLQVTSNMLCAIAKIDGHRLRTGVLNRDEKRNFLNACEMLEPAQLFIDDSPTLSTMELRAKGRRLKAQHDIEMICIDYLQLMTGSQESAKQGRQVEVSEISRQVKALARELEIPIICLAQLSRKVEERKDRRPMMSDLRESGCLTGDTLVTLADSGRRVPIGELEGKSGFNVWAVNLETYALEARPVSRAFSTGVKPVWRITTALGRTIRATANHKFLTLDGWKRLDELEVDGRLAIPRRTLALVGSASCQGGTLHSVNGSSAPPAASTLGGWEVEHLAEGDVYWDRIVSIEPAGTEPVFDLTVPGLHSFVANDIVVHNSIEQDADKIMLLHRPEYYEPEREELRGKATVILAKNRNGPTGDVELLFLRNQMRFESMSRM